MHFISASLSALLRNRAGLEVWPTSGVGQTCWLGGSHSRQTLVPPRVKQPTTLPQHAPHAGCISRWVLYINAGLPSLRQFYVLANVVNRVQKLCLWKAQKETPENVAAATAAPRRFSLRGPRGIQLLHRRVDGRLQLHWRHQVRQEPAERTDLPAQRQQPPLALRVHQEHLRPVRPLCAP